MRKIWNTILKGLVALLPVGLTIYLVYWLALAAERLFAPAIKLVVPTGFYWPGLGLLAGLVALYVAGLAVNAYAVRSALRFSDGLFGRIPVVKTIYVAIRDFMRFFPSSGHDSELKRVVLVPFGSGKIVGFVTAESGSAVGLEGDAADAVAVYLPMSYMVGGYTVFLPRELLEPTSLSIEAGMRLALMGGVQGAHPRGPRRERKADLLRASILPVTPFAQNCSLVWCDRTRSGAVIDPGGDLDRILAVARDENVRLEKILLTHAHIDHAGGAAELARSLELPIEGPHRGDQFWIDGLPEQSRMFGFPPSETFTPDRWLEDGDRVQVGEVEFEVLHCPGHTPGHVVFFSPADRIAFVGDVLFAGSIGRTDFPGGDHDTLIGAIRTKLLPLGDDVHFVPGHGPLSTFGEERRSNPFVK